MAELGYLVVLCRILNQPQGIKNPQNLSNNSTIPLFNLCFYFRQQVSALRQLADSALHSVLRLFPRFTPHIVPCLGILLPDVVLVKLKKTRKTFENPKLN